jgi:hypothetical protein
MEQFRCHWVRDKDGLEVLIPHCWAAVHDPAACTCDIEGSALERAEAARAAAEIEVERLREKLRRQADRFAAQLRKEERMFSEIRRLRAAQG